MGTTGQPTPPRTPAKLCMVCGRDTSSLPRVKDAQGRYACKSCVGLPASTAPVPAAAPSPSPRAASATVPAPVRVVSPPPVAAQVAATTPSSRASATDAPPPAAPVYEIDLTSDIIPLEDIAPTGTRAPCPKCQSAMAPGIAACPSCGYDPSSVPLNPDKAREVLGDFDNDGTFTSPEERERQAAKRKGNSKDPAAIACTKCGQSLVGVPRQKAGHIICPECGVDNRPPSRREYDQEVSASVERWAYLRPALMLGIGLAVCIVMWFADGWIQGGMRGAAVGWIGNGPRDGLFGSVIQVIVGLIGFVCASAIAVVVVFMAGLSWTGFSGTATLTILRTMGCLAAALAAILLVRAVPLPIPGLITIALGSMFFAYMLSEELDVYLPDAMIITVMTFAGVIVLSFVGLLVVL